MNVNGVEYVKADADREKRIKVLELALSSCETVMICRENEVGDRYRRAKGEIRTLVRDALNA